MCGHKPCVIRHRAIVSSSRRTLGLAETIGVLLDVAGALEALSDKVVHRDLKPENVLLLAGAWSVADFGIARYVDAVTATTTFKGWQTHEYAAPERWRVETATPATDVYSLGVMAYELIVGRRPFDGDQAALQDAHLHQALRC
ncbi:hypothetical protein E0H73_44435 [Kribbella pittospori]|uniref:Protein kinase domain-containing protein n=1 Tax=Kribbella pittospori TaxID=722689 RepID=A0A4R0JL73_9ACTN|nr:protein kinase [Kribbella pittospori]TCC45548.1 hypothetical protein E0H73_44435 [Kribbella pittospori]